MAGFNTSLQSGCRQGVPKHEWLNSGASDFSVRPSTSSTTRVVITGEEKSLTDWNWGDIWLVFSSYKPDLKKLEALFPAIMPER
jgi:hypothetical protein